MSNTKEIYNSTLSINETDILDEYDDEKLAYWKFIIKKDIVNINEKYDQNSNPLLFWEGQDEQEASIAAHKALYAMKRQELLVELIDFKLKEISTNGGI